MKIARPERYEAKKVKERARAKARYAADPEAAREKSRAKYAADPKAHQACVLAWRARNPDRVQAWHRRALYKKYGLTEDIIRSKLNSQHEACAICLVPFGTGATKMVIDHDHATGTARDLLCTICNTRLGNIEKRGVWLRQAVRYLRKHGGAL